MKITRADTISGALNKFLAILKFCCKIFLTNCEILAKGEIFMLGIGHYVTVFFGALFGGIIGQFIWFKWLDKPKRKLN